MVYQKCSNCGGKGYISVEARRDYITSADIPPSQYTVKWDDICRYCEGLGIVINEKCENCHGSGKRERNENVECADCRGKGILVRLESSQASPCPKCGGKGFTSKIWYSECYECRRGVKRIPNISKEEVLKSAYWQVIHMVFYNRTGEEKILGILKFKKTKYSIELREMPWSNCIQSIPLKDRQVKVVVGGKAPKDEVIPLLEPIVFDLIKNGWEVWKVGETPCFYEMKFRRKLRDL